MSREDDLELGRRAMERKWITRQQMEDALREVEENRAALADVLVRRGLLQTSQVIEVLREIHPPTRSLAPGEPFGKYQIVRELGCGGMGVVYEAQDRDLGRRVALKVLAQKLLPSHEDAERFLREARLAAKLRHPNIVAVHDFGILDEAPFFTMDLIEGRTLDRVLEDGSVDVRARIRILRQTAVAVHAAHQSEVIHRDLKPANILVDAALDPHVTDFGLAKDLRSQTMLTQSGTAMGTPSYMAPEQAMGIRDAMDARTDVYSLGVVLYQALTGVLPFSEESLTATLMKVTTGEPPKPRTVDPRVDRALELVCLKAMSRDRMKRYPSALELAEDLGRWLSGEPVRARPPGAVETLSRSVRRHPAGIAAVLVGIGAVAAFGIFLYFRPAKLRIQNPSGAIVEVDGTTRSAAEVGVKKGPHRIRARLEGHREWNAEIDVRPGEVRTIDVRMEPRAGRLIFDGLPDGTRISIVSEKSAIRLESPAPPLALREGSYRVACWAPGTVMVARELTVSDRQDLPLGLELPSALVWKDEAKYPVYVAPVVADLDGDGRPEIAYLSKDRLLRVLSGKRKLLHSHDTLQESHTELVVAEGKEARNLVFGRGTEGIQAFRGADLAPRFFHATRSRAWVVAVPGRGGSSNLITTDWEGEVSLLSGAALEAQEAAGRWTKSAMARIEGPAAVGDTDANQTVEVVVASHVPELLYLSLDEGREEGRVALPAPPCSPLALADVDGDFAGDLVLGLADGSIACVEGRGRRVRWRWKGDQPAHTRPLLADMDGDGRIEVVVGADDGVVVCLSGSDGTLRWRFRAQAQVRGTPVLADVNGDRQAEVVFGSYDGTLYALNASSGDLVWFFRAGGGVTAGPVVADLDGDGIAEILFGSDDNHLYAVRARAR